MSGLNLDVATDCVGGPERTINTEKQKLPNMNKIMCLFAMAALAMSAISANAEKPKGEGKPAPSAEDRFKKMDTNGDGAIKLDEFKSSPRGQKDPAKAEEMFKKLDTNSDGSVDLAELKAAPAPKKKGGKGDK